MVKRNMKIITTNYTSSEKYKLGYVRYYLIPVKFEELVITSVEENVKKRELCAIGGNINWCNHFG